MVNQVHWVIVTGMVAGLGTITPASGFVGPAGALVIGILAGFVCFNATLIIKRKLVIDDSLDVFPVHGVGGILGTILAGVFASTELGLFSGQGFLNSDITSIGSQVWVQIIGVLAVFAFTVVMTVIILTVVKALLGLRVDDEDEQTDLTSLCITKRVTTIRNINLDVIRSCPQQKSWGQCCLTGH